MLGIIKFLMPPRHPLKAFTGPIFFSRPFVFFFLSPFFFLSFLLFPPFSPFFSLFHISHSLYTQGRGTLYNDDNGLLVLVPFALGKVIDIIYSMDQLKHADQGKKHGEISQIKMFHPNPKKDMSYYLSLEHQTYYMSLKVVRLVFLRHQV